MVMLNMTTPGIPELPDLDEGQGRAKEDAALATALATTNIRQLPPASKAQGEVRAEEDLDASIDAAREQLEDKKFAGELDVSVPALHDPVHGSEKLG
jgi:hypothetical protein